MSGLLRSLISHRGLLAARQNYALARRCFRISSTIHHNDDINAKQRRWPNSNSATLPKLVPASVSSKRQELKKHLFFRFLDHIKNFDVILDKLLPAKAVQYYRLFTDGTKLLFGDMKSFANVYQILSDTSDWEKACKTLTKRELELYMTLPKDLLRVVPVLTLSALPLMQNVVFPLALMYPKQLLSSHFWSPKIRREVEDANQVTKHSYYRALFRDMELSVNALKGRPHHYACKQVMQLLINDTRRPSKGEILDLKPIFQTGGVFHLQSISARHVAHLLKAHGITDKTWWRHRLQQHGNLVNQIDRAISREEILSLTELELRSCCLTRGLNPNELDRTEMMEYLRDWVEISLHLDHNSISLLLHLPIFLGYNHKNRYWDTNSIM